MEEPQNDQKHLVDATDSLEAIAVFRTWKNVLFLILLLALLGLQAGFWLMNTGFVTKAEQTQIEAKVSMLAATPQDEQQDEPEPGEKQDKTAEKEEKAEKEGNKEAQEAKEKVVSQKEKIEQAAKQVAGKANEPNEREVEEQKPQTEESSEAGFAIEFMHISWLIRFLNWVTILAAGLYSLTLLLSLKVSLVGRLGGINHIARGFYWSLIVLVLVLPWSFFGGQVSGYLKTPQELLSACMALSGDNLVATVLFYLRYVVFWLLIVIFLLVAQGKSCKWIKATFHRLEVM